MTIATPPEDAQPRQPDPSLPVESQAPIRVCRECSTQAPTSGEFCPHCGARYANAGAREELAFSCSLYRY